jgi:hypothetical protein
VYGRECGGRERELDPIRTCVSIAPQYIPGAVRRAGGMYEIKPKGSVVGEKEREKYTSGGEIGCEKESPKDDESIRRTYPLKKIEK